MTNIDPQKKIEAERQAELDVFYKSKGWDPDRTVACKEYDLILTCDKGCFKIEEKIRTFDSGDFGVEIIQDLVSMNRGWFYTTAPDRLFYVLDDRIYSVNWWPFKEWFFKVYGKRKQVPMTFFPSINGYGLTLNLGVCWHHIPNHLYKEIPIIIEESRHEPIGEQMFLF